MEEVKAKPLTTNLSKEVNKQKRIKVPGEKCRMAETHKIDNFPALVFELESWRTS